MSGASQDDRWWAPIRYSQQAAKSVLITRL